MRRSFRSFRSLPFLLFALALPAVAPAAPGPETRAAWRHGLIWRAEPLAGGFPLVVKTPAGLDFSLELASAVTGEVVLRAGIEGGRPFRLLVPNGSYLLTFTYAPTAPSGAGPGAGAEQLRIEPALTFAVTGAARKEGHVVTLSETADGLDVAITGQALCQRVSRMFTGPVEIPVPVAPLANTPPDPGSALVRSSAPFPDPLIDSGDFTLKIRTVLCE